MNDLNTDFYRQNEWANLKLIEACRSLDDDRLDATAVGTYGSIRDTFLHLVIAETGYAYRLGRLPEPRLDGSGPWPGFDALAEMVTATATAFELAAREATDRTIRVGSESEQYEVEAAVILVQAFNHGTEHRSQICTILTTLGIEPPDLSGWEWGLASGRMRRA